MIARGILIFSFAAAFVAAAATAADEVRLDTHDEQAVARLMVRMPKPEYPLGARAKRIVGHGIYHLWFRPETGVITHIDILRSTGSKLLDDAALRAFRQWRAHPGAVSHMKVPITFSM